MRTRIRLLFIVLLLAALGYGAFWHFSARHLEKTANAEIALLEDKGFNVSAGKLQKGGFPYRLELYTNDVNVSAPRHALPWQGGADVINLFTHPWTPGHLVTQFKGFYLNVGDLSLTAPEGRASVLVNSDHGARLDADLGPVRLSFPAGGGSPLAASRMQIHLRFPGAGSANNATSEDPAQGQDTLLGPERADIAVSIKNLALGRFAVGAPAPAISRLAFISELHGRLPQPVSAQSLITWRDNGGTLEIKELDLTWGTVRISAEGSLALDEEMRPLGALTLDVVDAGPLIRYLASQGLIDKNAAPFLAEGIAAITTKGDDNAAHDALRLPLTIQNGQILLGPFPIATVGPVVKY